MLNKAAHVFIQTVLHGTDGSSRSIGDVLKLGKVCVLGLQRCMGRIVREVQKEGLGREEFDLQNRSPLWCTSQLCTEHRCG